MRAAPLSPAAFDSTYIIRVFMAPPALTGESLWTDPAAGKRDQLHGPLAVELGMVERRIGAWRATLGAGAMPPSIASRRSMRSCVFGCVEKRLSAPRPDSGLMMNRCAVAGLDSAALFGICAAPLEILASAEASERGRPQ